MDIDIAYIEAYSPKRKPYYITLSPEDRRHHLYVIGQTGTGKSTFLHNNAMQDMLANHGLAFIDVHGQNAETLLHHVPRHRVEDVIYFNPADQNPVGFNPLYNVHPKARHLVLDDMLSGFKALWPSLWGEGRMEYIMSNVLVSLLEYRKASLLDVKRILTDECFREEVLEKVTDDAVLDFWRNEYDTWNDRYRTESIAPIQNKIGQLLMDTQLRAVFTQPQRLNFRWLMDTQKIFIANLSKGKLGEKRSALFASLLVSHFFGASLTREDQEEEDRIDFYLYLDEVQNMATSTVKRILSESRKYRLNLTMAHQFIAQLPEEILSAVFGNLSNIVTFRVGSTDAKRLEEEFMHEVRANTLIRLENFEIVYKKLSHGSVSEPRRATTFAPSDIVRRPAKKEVVIKRSRRWYGGK